MENKAVLESRNPVIIISYHNNELFCCHLDGYHSNMYALHSRLTKIESEFLSRPARKNLKVWYNMDANRLDQATIELIVQSICRIHGQIKKIVFIGLRGVTKWKFNCLLMRALCGKQLSKAYYSDAESAKGWLIS